MLENSTHATLLFVLVGGVFVLMALLGSFLKRLPITSSIVYLAIGAICGPAVFGLLRVDALEESAVLERLTEIAVIVSLFTAGLKLRVPLSDRLWLQPLRLAFGSMAITVGLITLVGVFGLGLPVGAAVLLGAILAPTDPVLASDVQVANAWDRDRLRFDLTGEAGLNDGSAFPFVMLGLGLLGLHEIGEAGWRWLAVDVVWAVVGGIAVGGLTGTLTGRLVIYLRRMHREAFGLDDFLTLGLIALAYGLALLLHTYGFLAVFAAGLALRRIERQSTGHDAPADIMEMSRLGAAEEVATDPEKAPAYLAQSVLGFNEQLERIGEVAVVVLVGAMITQYSIAWDALWFLPVVFLVVRPLSVGIGLFKSSVPKFTKLLIGWFGIRGIGSIYYLMFAIQHGLGAEAASRLSEIVLTVVAASIVLHGLTTTPLLELYRQRSQGTLSRPAHHQSDAEQAASAP